LDYIHFVAVFIENEQAHALAFGMDEAERLLTATAAGFANDALPAGARGFSSTI